MSFVGKSVVWYVVCWEEVLCPTENLVASGPTLTVSVTLATYFGLSGSIALFWAVRR